MKDWVHLIPLPNTYRDSRHREEHMLEDLWEYHARWVTNTAWVICSKRQKHIAGRILAHCIRGVGSCLLIDVDRICFCM
jgi:hypothetical protein